MIPGRRLEANPLILVRTAVLPVYQQGGQQFRSLIETSRLTPAATRQSNDKPLSPSFLLTSHPPTP